MLRSSLLLSLLAVSAAASADNFDYNYLSLGYGNTDFDAVSADGDGFSLGGSYGIADQYHVFAGYEAADLESVVDATRWNAGFGYNTSMSDKVDLYARLSYEYVEFDAGVFGSEDDSGYGFGVGARFHASPKLELNAGIKHVDYSDLGDDTGLELGGLYSVTDVFSLGLAFDQSDDVSRYTLSGRFYFDN